MVCIQRVWSETIVCCRAKKAKKLTKQEQEHRRRNWIWLGCAASALVLYVLVSGQVLEISYNLGYAEEEEAEDDQ